jgi:flagellar L-ring protein FlgH
VKKPIFAICLSLLTVMILNSGCAKLMGNLRRDLDDSNYDSGPTTGGAWTEAGFLSDNMSDERDDRFVSSGRGARGLASEGRSGDRDGSWLGNDSRGTGQQQEVSFSNTPSIAPPTKRLYKNGNRATRADFVDESTNEGPLWASDGQTNYYFTKNKIRGVGDIVSLTVESDLMKDITAEIGRTLSVPEKERELELAQDRLDGRGLASVTVDSKKDQLASTAAAPGEAPIEERPKVQEKKVVEKREATWADVDLSKAVEMKAGDIVMAEIVERYPNGNYKLRGSKKIRYRNSYRYVNILGVVKGTDITETDTIASGKLYEYRLEAVR